MLKNDFVLDARGSYCLRHLRKHVGHYDLKFTKLLL